MKTLLRIMGAGMLLIGASWTLVGMGPAWFLAGAVIAGLGGGCLVQAWFLAARQPLGK